MPSPDHDRMDPGLEWRLKVALNRITPPSSTTPRYAARWKNGVRPWRLAPFALAAASVVLLALTATATTGSPNPAVWTGDAASTIGAVCHVAQPGPSPQPTAQPPAAPRCAAAPAPVRTPEHATSPSAEPTERPEESPGPEPTASPSPSDHHSRSSSPSPSPSPSALTADH